jgi:hypothetical protein
MKRKIGWPVAIIIAGLLAVCDAAHAQGAVGIRIGPPPLRHEVIVAQPHPGWVWVTGHWKWVPGRSRYVWVRGRWIAGRPGHVWVDGRWVHRKGGWFYINGGWRRH